MTINPLKWIGAGVRTLVRREMRSTLADPDPWLQSWFNGGGASKAGVIVNEQTALSFSAVFQAVRRISQGVASLPCPTYKRLPRGKEKLPAHPVFRLLNRNPNPNMPAYVMRETLMGHSLLWGNGYAEIERTAGGVPVALHVLRPDRVCPEPDPAGESVVYRVYQPGRANVILRKEDVLHIRGVGFDGLVGYSPIRLARQAIGLGLAAETYGASFFGNSSRPAGMIKYPGKLSDEAFKRLRESWEAVHGGPENANRTAILEEGGEFTPYAIPPEEAQFLGTRRFQTEEIARWFDIAPHMLMDLERATNNNIEQQALEFVQHTLMPWLIRWEEEVQMKLFTGAEQETHFVEHQLDNMLRADATARHNAYKTGIQFGYYCADDVREMENRNPLPDDQGQLFLVPVNMQPAQVSQKQAEAAEKGQPFGGSAAPAAPAAKPAPADAVADEPAKVDQNTKGKDIREAHRPLMADAVGRVVRREIEVLRRAARKPATFRSFVKKFYTEHADYTAGTIDPVLRALAASLLAAGETSATPTASEARVRGMASEAMTAVLAAEPQRLNALFNEWEQTRAAKATDQILAEMRPSE